MSRMATNEYIGIKRKKVSYGAEVRDPTEYEA